MLKIDLFVYQFVSSISPGVRRRSGCGWGRGKWYL